MDSTTVLLTRVPCSASVEPNSDHVEHVTQVRQSYPGETVPITVVAEERPLVDVPSGH